MALGYIFILFVVVCVLSIAGLLIMYLPKKASLRKTGFYITGIWSMVMAIVSATSFPSNWEGQQLISYATGAVALIGLVIYTASKKKGAVTTAYVLVTLSVIIGALRLII